MHAPNNVVHSDEELIELGRSVAARCRPGFEITGTDGTVRPIKNIEMCAFVAYHKDQQRLRIQRGECCGDTPAPDGRCLGELCPAHAAKTFSRRFLEWMEETTREPIA